MVADWLANFSDYRVRTELRASYEFIKSAFKIWIHGLPFEAIDRSIA